MEELELAQTLISQGDLEESLKIVRSVTQKMGSVNYSQFVLISGRFYTFEEKLQKGLPIEQGELNSIRESVIRFIAQLKTKINYPEYSSSSIRKSHLESHIGRLTSQLKSWEEKRFIAENPDEEERCRIAIKQIQIYLKEYESELAGYSVLSSKAEDLPKEYDAFVSFANEDKESFANPLVSALKRQGFTIWYSGHELTLGDSIMESVNTGLSKSRYGIVILSQSYLGKEWPISELHALFAKQTNSAKKIILPIWHKISYKLILEKSPLIADKFAIDSQKGLDKVIKAISQILRPGSFVQR
ncbi:MAG: toll/interleukin-1 receptor domain-containing protein [Bacteroidota bacterium]